MAESSEVPDEENTLRQRLSRRYNIHSRIGQGAWGVVYKAYDMEKQRMVALKIMHYDNVHIHGIPSNILREVFSLRSLMHAEERNIGSRNIVR